MQEWKHWFHYFNYFLHSVLIFFIFIMAVEQFSLWQLCHFKNILNRASKILVMGNWLIGEDCNERGGDVFGFWAYTSQPDVIQRVRKQLHFATFCWVYWKLIHSGWFCSRQIPLAWKRNYPGDPDELRCLDSTSLSWLWWFWVLYSQELTVWFYGKSVA